jgi:hypothetical protein
VRDSCSESPCASRIMTTCVVCRLTPTRVTVQGVRRGRHGLPQAACLPCALQDSIPRGTPTPRLPSRYPLPTPPQLHPSAHLCFIS